MHTNIDLEINKEQLYQINLFNPFGTNEFDDSSLYNNKDYNFFYNLSPVQDEPVTANSTSIHNVHQVVIRTY
jgi:hypothetical protein